jgi:hypothetical protein
MRLADGPQPLFVLGSGRCGSTLLYQLLSVHSRIAMTNEAQLVNFLYFAHALAGQPAFDVHEHVLNEKVSLAGIVGRQYAARFAEVVKDHAGPMLLDFYRAEFPGRDFAYFGDKLPSPIAAGSFGAIFPGIRCLTLLRDPRDVICSLRHYSARPEVAEGNPAFRVGDLREYCIGWRNLYASCLDYLPGNLMVRYEDVVADARRELTRIMAHLGLEPEPAQLADDSGRAREAARKGHATTATVDASIGRWRRDLPPADAALVTEVCEPLLRRCGYELA